MWMIKAVSQSVLSRVPGGEKLNYLLQRRRGVYSPQYISQRLVKLAARLKVLNGVFPLEGKSVLEIGTGWSAINPIMLYLMGVRTIDTYDHVAHLRHESALAVVAAARTVLTELAQTLDVPEATLKARLDRLEGTSSLDEFLARTGIRYHAPGDAANSGLPEGSVDLVYSYAVLEHVPKEALTRIVEETKRILKPDGASYHRIEFHDHFISFDKKMSAMNFLKYPEWLWALLVYNNMGYQNRLRERYYIDLFEKHGGKTLLRDYVLRPEDLADVRAMKVDQSFAGYTDEELAIVVSDIVTAYPRAA